MSEPTEHPHPTETEVPTRKKEIIIGAAVVLGAVVVIAGIALAIYSGIPKVVYQPAKACDLFTTHEAVDLLGKKAIKSGAEDPAISGDTAISKCGYTDGNPDVNTMVVAAITVRSGINDKGVRQNVTEFSSGKPKKNVQDIKGIGDKAYFNTQLGQLNILEGKKWIILSYGPGSAPQANTVEDATKLAKIVLH